MSEQPMEHGPYVHGPQPIERLRGGGMFPTDPIDRMIHQPLYKPEGWDEMSGREQLEYTVREAVELRQERAR